MTPTPWEAPVDADHTPEERALLAAGWVPVGVREWRDPWSGRAYPAWRASELMRRDAVRDAERVLDGEVSP